MVHEHEPIAGKDIVTFVLTITVAVGIPVVAIGFLARLGWEAAGRLLG